jgi:predicted nucleic acid-binding protein
MYVVDTNVISELRKAAAGKADGNVAAWASGVAPAALFISVVTVLELERGVLQIERRDHARGSVLRAWLMTRVLPAFEDRVLPIDTKVARRCAGLHIPNPRSDRDSLIAATALIRGMTVVTRNAVDFEGTGVPVLDPWAA